MASETELFYLVLLTMLTPLDPFDETSSGRPAFAPVELYG